MTRIRKKGKDETLRKKITYIYIKGGGRGGRPITLLKLVCKITSSCIAGEKNKA